MNVIKTLKELPRDMWIISLSTLINRTGTMVIPFLALYLTSQLGFSASRAGFIITVYGLGALITAPFVGKLADKIGAFKVIKLSLFFSGAMLLLYPHFSNYYLILLVTFVWAIIAEAYRPASLSLISEIVKPEQRKTAFALNRLMINTGMSIGPVAAGFLTMINYSIIFYVDAATSILAVVFLLFNPIVPFIDLREDITPGSSHKLFILKDTLFLLFLFSLLPASMVMFQHIGALPLYIVNGLGYTPAVFGLIAMVNTVLIIFIEVPLNAAMGKWTEKKSLSVGAFLIAIGFGAMAISGNIIWLIFTIVIWTFGEMIFFPASASLAAELAPLRRRGEYMGYFQMIFSASFALGPWLGTIVFENYGSVILWTGCMIAGLISAVGVLKIPYKKEGCKKKLQP